MREQMKQFSKNFGVMDQKDYQVLKSKRVLVVGLGGLGGNLCNLLVRLGLHQLMLVDFDRYDTTNLNRQLFSNHNTINEYKVDIIKEELLKINPNATIDKSISKIQDIPTSELKVYDYIIDTVDNPISKIYLSELGRKLNIPVLHGACAGWYGQVGWILPGNTLIEQTYINDEQGLEKDLMNPSFTPSAIASVMVSEFLKKIQNSDKTTTNQFLLVDLYNNQIIKTNSNE